MLLKLIKEKFLSLFIYLCPVFLFILLVIIDINFVEGQCYRIHMTLLHSKIISLSNYI
jgi:hypothetical protein